MIVQRERLKANLDLAKVEQEKEHFELEKAKEVDQLKTRFFANILMNSEHQSRWYWDR
jgi:hypothetical protein